MTKRTTQKLAELKELAKQAGSNIYQRVKLASEVLTDISWLASTFEGDELKALDFLQKEYFADLQGYVTIGRLRQLYNEFPLETMWREHDYDLALMEAKYKESHASDDPGLQGSRTSWKKECEKLVTKNQQLESDRQRDIETAKTATSEVATLRCRVRELECENAQLLGRITELERIVERQFEKV